MRCPYEKKCTEFDPVIAYCNAPDKLVLYDDCPTYKKFKRGKNGKS